MGYVQTSSQVIERSKLHIVSIKTRHILGKKNILGNQLSHPVQVLPTEWSLLPKLFKAICEVFGHPYLELFATRANGNRTLFNVFRTISICSSPPFTLQRQVLLRLMLWTGLSMILVAPLWPRKECFADPLTLPAEEPLEIPMLWNLLVQTRVRGLQMLQLRTWKLSSNMYKRQTF